MIVCSSSVMRRTRPGDRWAGDYSGATPGIMPATPFPRTAMFNRTTAIILVAALAVASGLWGMQHWMLRNEHARPQLQAVKLFDQPRALPSFSLQQSDQTPLIPGELKGHWTLVFL